MTTRWCSKTALVVMSAVALTSCKSFEANAPNWAGGPSNPAYVSDQAVSVQFAGPMAADATRNYSISRFHFASPRAPLSAGIRRDLGFIAHQLQDQPQATVEIVATSSRPGYDAARAGLEAGKRGLAVRQLLHEQGIASERVTLLVLEDEPADGRDSGLPGEQIEIVLRSPQGSPWVPIRVAARGEAGGSFLADPLVVPAVFGFAYQGGSDPAADDGPYLSDSGIAPGVVAQASADGV